MWKDKTKYVNYSNIPCKAGVDLTTDP
jgi:hypothetical protein